MIKKKIQAMKKAFHDRKVEMAKLEASNCFGTTSGTWNNKIVIPKHFNVKKVG